MGSRIDPALWGVTHRPDPLIDLDKGCGMTSRREECLSKAREIVTKDRAQAYGSAEDNFSNIAEIWNAQGVRIDGKQLVASDVAVLMVGMKLARLRHNPTHEDSWVDVAGYAACGSEVAFKPADNVAPIVARSNGYVGTGWVSFNRCGTMLEHGKPVARYYGPNPHAAHSYGRDNGQWCDGYI
jgi:hypothetical protein